VNHSHTVSDDKRGGDKCLVTYFTKTNLTSVINANVVKVAG